MVLARDRRREKEKNVLIIVWALAIATASRWVGDNVVVSGVDLWFCFREKHKKQSSKSSFFVIQQRSSDVTFVVVDQIKQLRLSRRGLPATTPWNFPQIRRRVVSSVYVGCEDFFFVYVLSIRDPKNSFCVVDERNFWCEKKSFSLLKIIVNDVVTLTFGTRRFSPRRRPLSWTMIYGLAAPLAARLDRLFSLSRLEIDCKQITKALIGAIHRPHCRPACRLMDGKPIARLRVSISLSTCAINSRPRLCRLIVMNCIREARGSRAYQ
jgi:hypothetical protein